ncbi:hypothetical protein [Alsobacter sp. R-9]
MNNNVLTLFDCWCYARDNFQRIKPSSAGASSVNRISDRTSEVLEAMFRSGAVAVFGHRPNQPHVGAIRIRKNLLATASFQYAEGKVCISGDGNEVKDDIFVNVFVDRQTFFDRFQFDS